MQQAVAKLAEDLIPVLGAFLLAVLTAGLETFRKYLKQKASIELSEAVSSELGALAQDAVSFTEEYAHKHIKKLGLELPFSDKEALAIRTLQELAKKHNLTEERARQLVLVAVQHSRPFVVR